jgi:hypothetical protein
LRDQDGPGQQVERGNGEAGAFSPSEPADDAQPHHGGLTWTKNLAQALKLLGSQHGAINQPRLR